MQNAIQFLTQADPIFQTIIDRYGFPEIPVRAQGFETLVLLILEQQVSIDSAKATFVKLKSIATNFQPEILINIPNDDYRVIGVSRQKTLYIKCLATAIIDNIINLESLPTKTPDAVRLELIQIKGIGNWTIDIYLMFSLQTPDIIPLGDIAVVNTIKELLDIHQKSEMEEYTHKWAPYRSYATFLLWHHYLKKRNRKVSYLP